MTSSANKRLKNDRSRPIRLENPILMGDDHFLPIDESAKLAGVPTLIVGKRDDYNCKLLGSFVCDPRSWNIPSYITGEKEFADELLIYCRPVYVVPKKRDSLDIDRLKDLLDDAGQVVVLEHAGLSTLVEVSASQESGLPVYSLIRGRNGCRVNLLRNSGYIMKYLINESIPKKFESNVKSRI